MTKEKKTGKKQSMVLKTLQRKIISRLSNMKHH